MEKLKDLKKEIKELRIANNDLFNSSSELLEDLNLTNKFLMKHSEEIHLQNDNFKKIQEDYIEAFKHIRKMEEIRANEKAEKTKGMFSVMPIILQTATEFFKSLKKEKINPPTQPQPNYTTENKK